MACKLLLALLIACTLLAVGSKADQASLPMNVSWWDLYLGLEFPGAHGTLTAGFDSTSEGFLRLDYDFTQNDTVPFNPAYIAATNTDSFLSGAVAELATSLDSIFHLRYRLSNSQIGLRFVDSTGQTFQVSSIVVPLESEGDPASIWIDYRVQLGQLKPPYVSFWGGSGSGNLTLPLKSVSVLCNGNGAGSTGWLEFDSVELYSGDENNAVLANSSLLPGRFTGSLGSTIGANIHFTSDSQALDLIQQAGMKWVRMDFAWGLIEAVPDSYNFAAYDVLVNLTTARGLHVLAILDYGNPYWTGGAPPLNDTQLAAWGRYVNATIVHFHGRDVIFECWNEPDIPGFWNDDPNATQYGSLLIETVERFADAKNNYGVDATLLSGGLSSPSASNYAFWDSLLAMDAMTGTNGWGTHLYTGSTPESRWPDTERLQSMAADNDIGDLWCTEWGYSSTTLSATGDGMDPVSLYKQALYNVRQILLAWWSNLSLMILYDIRNDGTDTTYNEHNFGLLFNNYTAKPSYNAVAQILSLSTAGYGFDGLRSWSPQPIGLHVAEFTRSEDDATLFIAWLSGDGDPDVTVVVPTRHFVKATDLFGDAFSVADDTITLSTSAPFVYLYYSADPLATEEVTTTKAATNEATTSTIQITSQTTKKTTASSTETRTSTAVQTTSTKKHSGGGGCFAESSQVRVLKADGRLVPTKLSDVRIGDFIESLDEQFHQTFSEVYYLLHDKSSHLVSMIELVSTAGTSVRVTPLHLLFTASQRQKDKWSLQTANMLQVGDWILVDFEPKQIGAVHLQSEAIRAPLTLNDRIVVDGVAASVFSYSETLYRPLTSLLKLAHRLFPSLLHSSLASWLIAAFVHLTDQFEASGSLFLLDLRFASA